MKKTLKKKTNKEKPIKKVLTIVIDTKTEKRLNALCKQSGLKKVQVIRNLINQQ